MLSSHELRTALKVAAWIKEKKILVFGTGSGGQRFTEAVAPIGAMVIGYVDNNQAKWGTTFLDKPVFPPSRLTEAKSDEVVFIASTYYDAISQQLTEMGLRENIHFYDGLAVFSECYTCSETSKVRDDLRRFCVGNGLDIGFGGDPIVDSAICMDMPKRYVSYNYYPQHLHGDANHLCWFADESLDYIYSSHVLEDFRDTAQVLDEWLRVLKPGGHLILFLPDEPLYRQYCRERGEASNPYHIHEHFGPDYLKDILDGRDDVEIIHERYPSHIYNFEMVLRKKRASE
ncbi:methyltransferase domain-containing protein [Heliobacterium gestii]|uniref:Methyltransferase domain-containing protein n=1 Tax=Heliomicrobium gestii TaxID=2699 RepID=A0A845LJG7_HELGE|nr:class I SAM-dependent methyltransferase [Heliomicrobium gestii]MBM7866704.1 SAM-dependent methyltransferase [Heliomicrobium gestii]MZP43016.1 methyltransferase domain-containing protein [Heliomicrobium gestii]